MLLRKKVVLFICCFISLLFMNGFKVSAEAEVQRFGGADRYETSIKISQNNFETTDYIILVSGGDFPDALSAAPLSKKYNAPILLTRKDELSEEIIEEIKRLNAKEAFILGGNQIISENVEKQLTDINVNSSRIYGKDRYETSLKVAEVLGSWQEAFLVSGQNFPDAVSAAPIAALKGMPIILTKGKEMPEGVKSFVRENSSAMYYIVGGQEAVSDSAVINDITYYKRLEGKNRYKTNEAVIKEFLNDMAFDNTYIASGQTFPDALSGAAAAVKTSSPIVLVSKNYDVRNSIIKENLDKILTLTVLGQKEVISDLLVNNILSGGKIKIVIDPGHGGSDPGAIGPTGKREKDANLAISLKLGEILKENGIEVVYTRDSDKINWPSNTRENLQARVDIAKNENANYFISIHNNSATSFAYGTESYYYGGDVEGKKLAQGIHGELVKATGLFDRKIKSANFYVLKNTDIPAVLVEVAFISNANEEKLLFSEDFQYKAAQAIASGILNTIN